MTDKIKELLSVSNMTEEEQLKWIANYLRHIIPIEAFATCKGEIYLCNQNRWILADLAFRLRDEAKRKYINAWYIACKQVSIWLMTSGKTYYDNVSILNLRESHHYEASVLKQKPTIWVITTSIAALITKELAKEQK